MSDQLTIGKVVALTGVPARTIRFYEAEGVIAAPARTEAGYRIYSASDVRRLRLARGARTLGLPLPEVKALVDQAFQSDCLDFGDQLLARISDRRVEIDQRIAELEELKAELLQLEQHIRHDQQDCLPGQKVAECSFCPMIDEKGGGESDSVPMPVRQLPV